MISVIVPVYNAEKTLKRLIKSLVAQTDGDFEAIFVNDGSIDKSGEILEDACRDEKNYRVITTKNGGAAAARNIGIDKAKGDYICFIDADDVVSPNYLKTMRELAENNNADVVCTKYARNKTADFEKVVNDVKVIDNQESVDMLLRMEINNSPFAKLFSRKAVGEMRMPNAMVAEDLFFNYCVLKRAKRVVLNDSVLYSYITTDGSLSTKFSDKRMESLKVVQDIDAKEQSFYSMARVFMEAYFICERIVVSKGTKKYATEFRIVCDILKKDRKKILDDKRSTKRQRLIATALRFGPVFTAKMMTAKSRLKKAI